jgi:hypothetical protein
MKNIEVNELVGKVLTKIEIDKSEEECIRFYSTDGKIYKMYHEQNCCENVRIKDICGDINDLIDSPILIANESTNSNEVDICESETWTFYNFSTVKGHITITWLGESNGYYSESVDFIEINR